MICSGAYFSSSGIDVRTACLDFLFRWVELRRGRKPCKRCERRLQPLISFCSQSQLLAKIFVVMFSCFFVMFSFRQKTHCIIVQFLVLSYNMPSTWPSELCVVVAGSVFEYLGWYFFLLTHTVFFLFLIIVLTLNHIYGWIARNFYVSRPLLFSAIAMIH